MLNFRIKFPRKWLKICLIFIILKLIYKVYGLKFLIVFLIRCFTLSFRLIPFNIFIFLSFQVHYIYNKKLKNFSFQVLFKKLKNVLY